MMDREIILKILKKLGLPKDQYCVMTGAALVLHGVKQLTRDIDIGCSEDLFQALLQQGHPQQQQDYGGILLEDCIEIYRNWKAEKIVYIENIPVASIASIRAYKEKLARAKDLEDIKLIDEFLETKAKHELECRCK